MSHFDADGCGYDHPGDAKAAQDPPLYPPEWTAEQRLSAYWFAVGRSIEVRSIASWRAILADAQRTGDRHHRKIAEIFTAARKETEVPW